MGGNLSLGRRSEIQMPPNLSYQQITLLSVLPHLILLVFLVEHALIAFPGLFLFIMHTSYY